MLAASLLERYATNEPSNTTIAPIPVPINATFRSFIEPPSKLDAIAAAFCDPAKSSVPAAAFFNPANPAVNSSFKLPSAGKNASNACFIPSNFPPNISISPIADFIAFA
ncbi:hypothetical protein D3C86_1818740 [compost metagenome]